jgi:GT2 family glycosyltransferase/2-polyprenyl-3-methyl-5-hydroxy-6-metoxy-1,4-benzoquinol methylase
VRADDLTVAIPTRDRWPILERTLDALRGQTVGGFETIVVCDGLDQRPAPAIEAAPGVRVLTQEHAGPGVARNRAVAASRRPLLLFLGDDMVPAADLVQHHLARHVAEPAQEVAVLGRVLAHPAARENRVMRWLDWSGAQFHYAELAAERAAGQTEAGFGRFYSCNVSLKRALFTAAVGFDPDFGFDYEDLDLGWRLHALGLRLRYEPLAVARHLHHHDWESVEHRYASRARGERLMAAKHPWFTPWFHHRISWHAQAAPVARWWPAVAELVPERAPELRARARRRADRRYHQRLAPAFFSAWEGERDLEELRAYLGADYDQRQLVTHRQQVDDEARRAESEECFYRTSTAYLYDLTAFAMSGAKDPYRQVLRRLVAPGARLLDYGCGIGSDGLRLLDGGYRVHFADFENPSTRYLRWRLEHRGLHAPVHDLDGDVPGGFDAAYAFDVIEHVDDPFALLRELERRAAVVVVNLLEPVDDDTPLHRALPIGAILRHASRQGVLAHRVYDGRSHLVAYRSAPVAGHAAAARSHARRWLGPLSQRRPRA